MSKFSHILTAVLLMVSALFAVIRPSIMDLDTTQKKEDILVKEYIILRNTIVKDAPKMASRWGGKLGVCYRSTDSVCSEFAKTALEEQDIISDERLERSVKFIDFSRQQPGVWEAEFLTKDKVKNGEEIINRHWHAVIYASYTADALEKTNLKKEEKEKSDFLITYYAQEERPLRILPKPMVNIKEMVSRYISVRFSTFGTIEDTALYWGERGPLRQMSSLENYNDIAPYLAQDIVRLNLENLERAILVEDVQEITPDNWQVDFKSFDFIEDNKEPKIREWTAFLKIGFREKNTLFDGIDEPLLGVSKFFEGFNNASGFMVEEQKLFSKNNVEITHIDSPELDVFKNREQMIIDYLRLRNTITEDVKQMRHDWGFFGKVRELSSEKAFFDFYSKAIFLYDSFFKTKQTREFEILTLDYIGAKIDEIGGEEWKAAFLTKDFDQDHKLIEERVWNAFFRTSVIPETKDLELAKIKPYKFLVHNYNTTSSQVFPNNEKTSEQAFIEKYTLEQLKTPEYKVTVFSGKDINNYKIIFTEIDHIIDNFFRVFFITKPKLVSNTQKNLGQLWRAEINLHNYNSDEKQRNFNVDFFNLELE